MPEEYLHCVETERKKHPLKEAKRICAIAYWKRHGKSVKEYDKKVKKSVDMMEFVVKVARTKKALKQLANTVAKSVGVEVDSFVILPLTDAVRNHPKLKAFEPKVEDEDMKYMLIRKAVGDTVLVEVTLDGKLKLNLDELPENTYAEQLNVPEREDASDKEVVDVGKEKEATKAVEVEKCKGEGCEDKKEVTKDFEPERMEKVEPEYVDFSEEFKVKVAALLEDKLSEEEMKELKALLKGLKVYKALEEEEVVKAVDEEEEKEEKKEEKKEDKKEEKEESAKDTLGKVMAKVAKGEELTALERKILSAAVAATKDESGESEEKAKDTLGKVMSKVAKGEELTETERKILSAAVDAAKKAKSEVVKSVMTAFDHMKEEITNPAALLYKEMTGFEPINGLFAFSSRTAANNFARRLNVKALSGRAYVRTPTIEERRSLPNHMRFIVVFE